MVLSRLADSTCVMIDESGSNGRMVEVVQLSDTTAAMVDGMGLVVAKVRAESKRCSKP